MGVKQQQFRKPTSVALSIHQPSSKLFALFDRLLILAPGGRVVFFGPAQAAERCFERVGLPIPRNWNPTDHYIECVGNTEAVDKLAAMAAAVAGAKVRAGIMSATIVRIVARITAGSLVAPDVTARHALRSLASSRSFSSCSEW